MNLESKWKAERERAAFLALADGTVFRGVAFGARKDAVGEVVFNTGMSGYQEILTDPSYAGQFVALTYPEVGNYGVTAEDDESRGLWLSGLVTAALDEPSNWRAERSLDDCLEAAGRPGIYGVDTRALTEHVRDHGNQKAYLHVEPAPLATEEGVARARAWEGLDGKDYAAKVTCSAPYDFPSNLEPSNLRTFEPTAGGPRPLVVVYDFGVKANILRSLATFARVTVVPAKTSAEEVLGLRPDGVFLSNGPADPAAVTYAIENIRKLLGMVPMDGSKVRKFESSKVPNPNLRTCEPGTIPIMGICLGHQLLALACGARTGRLAFGHHGCNHPVKDLETGAVRITSQNHNFTVLPETLPPCLAVTQVNLNDGPVEGLRHTSLPAFSVQFHPEACPGPRDAAGLFDSFRAML